MEGRLAPADHIILLFIVSFSAQTSDSGRLEVGGTGCFWNARPWLLWVKPPTCCFWKGWRAGWDLGQTFPNCPWQSTGLGL